MCASRHVTSRSTEFIWQHENRTPIGTIVPIMGELFLLETDILPIITKSAKKGRGNYDDFIG